MPQKPQSKQLSLHLTTEYRDELTVHRSTPVLMEWNFRKISVLSCQNIIQILPQSEITDKTRIQGRTCWSSHITPPNDCTVTVLHVLTCLEHVWVLHLLRNRSSMKSTLGRWTKVVSPLLLPFSHKLWTNITFWTFFQDCIQTRGANPTRYLPQWKYASTTHG